MLATSCKTSPYGCPLRKVMAKVMETPIIIESKIKIARVKGMVQLDKLSMCLKKNGVSESSTYIMLGKAIHTVRIVVGKQYADLTETIAP
jgi:hypothetical protein